jgi:hypothetical protein
MDQPQAKYGNHIGRIIKVTRSNGSVIGFDPNICISAEIIE